MGGPQTVEPAAAHGRCGSARAGGRGPAPARAAVRGPRDHRRCPADGAARRVDRRRDGVRGAAGRLARPRVAAPARAIGAVDHRDRSVVSRRARRVIGRERLRHCRVTPHPSPRSPDEICGRPSSRGCEDSRGAELPARCLDLSATCGLPVTRVYVRNQRSRWGACSPKRVITLNWRLIQMPPEVSDYIIIHELMHLKQPNHSRRFWREVDAACSWWRAAERWLRTHGRELM